MIKWNDFPHFFLWFKMETHTTDVTSRTNKVPAAPFPNICPSTLVSNSPTSPHETHTSSSALFSSSYVSRVCTSRPTHSWYTRTAEGQVMWLFWSHSQRLGAPQKSVPHGGDRFIALFQGEVPLPVTFHSKGTECPGYSCWNSLLCWIPPGHCPCSKIKCWAVLRLPPCSDLEMSKPTTWK